MGTAVESLIQHVRAGYRSLRAAPAFAATAIVTLALGIGLATAVFTVADALLLRRLPLPDQERVVVLAGESAARGMDNVPLDLADAREFARGSRTLARAAFFNYEGAAPVTVRDGAGGASVTRLQRALVSGDYFAVLGARPALGRALRPEDDAPGAAPAMVISHRAWRERFGGAPDVVGRRVETHEDGLAWTVVGVMPAGLDWPRGTDAWAPMLRVVPPESARHLSLDVVARLAPGATAADAGAELTTFFRRPGADAFYRDVRGAARPLPGLVLGDTRPAVVAFAAAAALLLLITCIDVANLLLVRGLARVREVAVRSALGASRARVVAGLLAEHALLAAAGGVLGVGVAAAAVRAFVALAPDGLPRRDEIALDGAALAGAFAITALATLLFAVAPALLASRVEVQQALRAGARQSGSRRARVLREALVAGQVALALVVLSAAALVGRSLARLRGADLAFDPAGVVVAELAYDGRPGRTAQTALAELGQLLPAIRALPGVTGVSTAVSVPYATTRGWAARPGAEGQTAEEAARNPLLDMEVVGPEFFATLGVRVLRGRPFADADGPGAPPVVVLSESAARHHWPDEDPLGKRIVMGPAGDPRAPRATVVGVVPDVRYRDLRAPGGAIYFPLRQSSFPFAPTTLVIRGARDAGDVTAALRRAIAESAPEVALVRATPFRAMMAGPLAEPRMNALLLAVFAATAVLLAGVGLFGVLATMVRQRARELGVRMALGATAGDVARLVLGRALALAAAGTAAGLAGALAANRLLGALLYEVSPTDAPTLLAAAAALLAVAAAAGALPALAGRRVDPASALRSE